MIVLPLTASAGMLGMFGTLLDDPQAAPVSAEPEAAHSIALLSAALSVDPYASRGGGDIIIEEGALAASGDPREDDLPKRTQTGGEISVYVVRDGDSLSQIAEMFEVTTNTILWANDISDPTTIQPGDTLVILPIVGVQHIVKSGDTISTIAKKYEGDTDEILAYNQLTTEDELSVGDTLVIPGGEIAAPAAPRYAAASPTKVTGSSASSNFSHPLPGAIRTQGIHGYNAVDLAAGVGTPIRAAAPGEVIVSKAAGWNGGYGKYVVVRHGNGAQTLYAHNSSNAVSVGQYVAQGQTIGYVGNSGRSTGAHLHFEVRGARNPF